MSSLRPEQQVVQHFTHTHPLTNVDGFGWFTCNGCKTYGFGNTYRCASCNYDLHEYCATCPPTLLSFMHPQHELKLVLKETHQNQNRRICDVCHEPAEGLYYNCEACGFDVHPICTRLPQHVSHVPHPAHVLELSYWGAGNTCMACNGAIRSWRYKCGQCRLDFHLECVKTASAAATGIQQRSLEVQPHFQPSQYYHHHQPYYINRGYGYNYANPNQSGGQRQNEQSGRRRGGSMFGILMVAVVSDLIADAAEDALAGLF